MAAERPAQAVDRAFKLVDHDRERERLMRIAREMPRPLR